MSTLTDQIRAALDRADDDADEYHHVDCENIRDRAYPFPCTCGEPGRRRRMVAAHRKILDQLPAIRALQVKVSEEWDPGEPVGDGEAEAILAALAEYYEVEVAP